MEEKNKAIKNRDSMKIGNWVLGKKLVSMDPNHDMENDLRIKLEIGSRGENEMEYYCSGDQGQNEMSVLPLMMMMILLMMIGLVEKPPESLTRFYLDIFLILQENKLSFVVTFVLSIISQNFHSPILYKASFLY